MDQDKRRKEALKKYSDWRWRLNHLYKINDKKGDRVLFKENPFQSRVNDLKDRYKLILKPRQVGISTNELIKQFDKTIHTKNFNACILAHKREVLPVLFKITRRAYDNMPTKLQPEIDKGGGSQYEMRFPKLDSRIFVTLDAISQTIHWLHISEAAFISDPSKIKDTMEAVPKDTGIITMETTPNGMGNYFYDQWTENDNFTNVFFPWFLFPEYRLNSSHIKELTDEEKEFCKKAKQYFGTDISLDQIAFRREKKSIQKHDFLKYYPEDDKSCFLVSNNQPIDLLLVSEILREAPEPISDNGWMKIWEDPTSSKSYVCGADVAEGVEGDYSVACMYDARSRKKVAQIRSNKWKPGDFADKINDFCEMYSFGNKVPLLGVELNNHGHAVVGRLDDTHLYRFLYYASENNKKKKRPGWITDRITRPLMIDTYIEGLENGTIEEPDKDTLKECLTLVNKDGKIEAAEGKHDDCVIASSIGLQMCLDLIPNISYGNGSMSKSIRI